MSLSTELVGDDSCDRLRGAPARGGGGTGRPTAAADGTEDVDDRAAVTKLQRRLPVDDERAANACRQRRIGGVEVVGVSRTTHDLSEGVDDNVDSPERLDRLSEQPLNIELVGHLAANGERGAVGSENLLDGGLGRTLVPGVVDDDGEAAAGQRARYLTAKTAAILR